MSSVILLSMLMILLSILSVIRHLLCGNNLNWLLNLNLIYETLWTGARSGLLVSMLGKLNWFRLTTSKKIEALIRFMRFFSREFALHLYKSTIRPCVEYCCHIWAGAPSCYLGLLDKLQKRIYRTVCPLLAASLEPLVHRRNLVSLSLFCRYYFSRCFSQLVPLPFCRGRSTCYSDRLLDFFITIPRCYEDVYVNSFFTRTARLWNALSIECFPLKKASYFEIFCCVNKCSSLWLSLDVSFKAGYFQTLWKLNAFFFRTS